MKIGIIKDNINLYSRLRKAGYHPDKLQRRSLSSFSRSIFNTRYPRFHLYYNTESGEINIHLDHKAPRYGEASDHGAEYDGELIIREAERLKTFLK